MMLNIKLIKDLIIRNKSFLLKRKHNIPYNPNLINIKVS